MNVAKRRRNFANSKVKDILIYYAYRKENELPLSVKLMNVGCLVGSGGGKH